MAVVDGYVPAGTILPFAGDDTKSVVGWLLCDGTKYSKNEYPELAAAIGNANGGEGDNFQLPDLRGRFIRGSSSSRKPGTVAPYTTHNPGFSVGLWHLPTRSQKFNEGFPWGRNMVLWNSGSDTFEVKGGDNETRPVNVYMNFIIKAQNDSSIPAGSLVPYAADDNSTSFPDLSWMLCNGNRYRQSVYNDLFKVISTRFLSRPSKVEFAIPSIPGLFIRGVDSGAGQDPDVSFRIALDGTKGPFVGTLQEYATSGTSKTGSPFKVTIPHYPHDQYHAADKIAGHNNLHRETWTNGQDWKSGADLESRPMNAAVSYYINSREDKDNSKFPLGGIIAIPGDLTPDGKHWLPTDGRLMKATEYQDLFAVLGTVWGGNSDSFNLPDLRGQFLRATDPGSVQPWGDPDHDKRFASNAGGVTAGTGSKQNFATGPPKKPFQIDINYPSDDTINAATAIGAEGCSYDGGQNWYASEGGDAETAPVNVAVAFFIKVA